jgi:hypothetical protein
MMRTPSGPSPSRDRICARVILIVAALAAISIAALAAISKMTDDAANSSAQTPVTATASPARLDDLFPPQVGDQYVLGEGATKIGCYPTAGELDRLSDAVMKHDDEGFRELAQDAIVIQPGTTVRVLDYNVWNGYLKVRVRSGDYAGSACWYLVGNDNGSADEPFFARRTE